MNRTQENEEWPDDEDLVPLAHQKGLIDTQAAAFPNGYTKAEAIAVLKLNSNREVHEDYVRGLARLKRIRAKKIHERLSIYNRLDVNNYVVEEPGVKAGRSATELAEKRKKTGAKRKRSPNKPKKV